jgi:hypothetical protein
LPPQQPRQRQAAGVAECLVAERGCRDDEIAKTSMSFSEPFGVGPADGPQTACPDLAAGVCLDGHGLARMIVCAVERAAGPGHPGQLQPAVG